MMGYRWLPTVFVLRFIMETPIWQYTCMLYLLIFYLFTDWRKYKICWGVCLYLSSSSTRYPLSCISIFKCSPCFQGNTDRTKLQSSPFTCTSLSLGAMKWQSDISEQWYIGVIYIDFNREYTFWIQDLIVLYGK